MGTSYKMSFAYFECRKAFKREYKLGSNVQELSCPQCGRSAYNLGRHFKPPKNRDTKQWETVHFLFEHGFRFQKIRTGSGCQDTVPYPETLNDAREFVVKYKDYSISDSEQSNIAPT